MATYCGRTIDVTFNALPALVPELLVTTGGSRLLRWWKAGRRRRFRLPFGWLVRIDCGPRGHKLRNLEGTILIPSGEGPIYDGASVPLPSMVTFFTLGILRPHGVMLTGSIVHDYAYRTGKLKFLGPNGTKDVRVQRHEADLLFREMIRTVNGMAFWAFIAWLAVRIGWFAVKYNDKRFCGKPPVGISVGLFVMLGILWYFFCLVGRICG